MLSELSDFDRRGKIDKLTERGLRQVAAVIDARMSVQECRAEWLMRVDPEHVRFWIDRHWESVGWLTIRKAALIETRRRLKRLGAMAVASGLGDALRRAEAQRPRRAKEILPGGFGVN